MKTFSGNFVGTGMRMGIVIARFNDAIGKQLLDGAIDALVRHDVADDAIDVAWVPGAVEVPLVAKKMAETGRYDAIITLGAVIRGETTHYDYVAGGSAAGVANVSLDTGIPILLGIVTTENLDQAWARAGTKAGNNGAKAAMAAIEMVNVIRQIEH